MLNRITQISSLVAASLLLAALSPASAEARVEARVQPEDAFRLEVAPVDARLEVDLPSLTDATTSHFLALAAQADSVRIAQLAPAPAPSSAPQEVPPPGAEVPTRTLEAQALYRWGLYAVSEGAFDQARQLFERVVKDYADTPAATSAQERLTELGQKPINPAMVARRNSGRGEFMISQTLAGAYLGVIMPSYWQDDLTPQSSAAFLLLGMGAGLGGSIFYTQYHPLTPDQAATIYYSQLFTAANLSMWTLGLAYDAFGTSQDVTRTLTTTSILGIGLGTLAGGWIAHNVTIPEGRVALASSAGLWTAGLGMMGLALVGGDNVSGRAYLLASPLLADVGLAGALLLADKYNLHISRNRMRVINLGGVAGAATGFLLGAVMQVGDARTAGWLTLLGAGGGLVVGATATKNWDAETAVTAGAHDLSARTPSSSVLVFEDGRMKLGQAMPTITWEQKVAANTEETDTKAGTKSSKPTPKVQLTLMEGRF